MKMRMYHCLFLKELFLLKDKHKINISLKNTSLLIKALMKDCKLYDINGNEDMLFTNLSNHFKDESLTIKHYILAKKEGMDFDSYLNSLNIVNVESSLNELVNSEIVEEVCQLDTVNSFQKGGVIKIKENDKISNLSVFSEKYKDLYETGKLNKYNKDEDVFIRGVLPELTITSETKNEENKHEYFEAIKDISFSTLIDQLPDLASKYKNNPYINNLLKLPHINKWKSVNDLFIEGRPVTAISDLLKIPKFSNAGVDFAINFFQQNPENFDIKSLEDKYLSPVRLASLKNKFLLIQIGKERSLNKNLPSISQAYLNLKEKYNIQQNDLISFIEKEMPKLKSYQKTLESFEKTLKNK